MIKEELKMHHYNMWDFIIKSINEANSVARIHEYKEKYCKFVGLDPIHSCFMCEFAYLMRTDDEPTLCAHCPSVLEMFNDGEYGCLADIYSVCCSTSDIRTQLILARLIRDSWKDCY